jgi:hypothetical protein
MLATREGLRNGAGERTFSKAQNGMNDFGKVLMVVGLAMAAAGFLLWSGLGKNWLGRFPGDIHYTRGNFSFYFPIITCLVVSALLTLALWLFKK